MTDPSLESNRPNTSVGNQLSAPFDLTIEFLNEHQLLGYTLLPADIALNVIGNLFQTDPKSASAHVLKQLRSLRDEPEISPWKICFALLAGPANFEDPLEQKEMRGYIFQISKNILSDPASLSQHERLLKRNIITLVRLSVPENIGEIEQFFYEESNSIVAQHSAIRSLVDWVREDPQRREEPQVRALSNQIYGIAKKYLSPDEFKSGYIANTATASIAFLTDIGDSRVPELNHNAEQLERPWLLRHISILVDAG